MCKWVSWGFHRSRIVTPGWCSLGFVCSRQLLPEALGEAPPAPRGRGRAWRISCARGHLLELQLLPPAWRGLCMAKEGMWWEQALPMSLLCPRARGAGAVSSCSGLLQDRSSPAQTTLAASLAPGLPGIHSLLGQGGGCFGTPLESKLPGFQPLVPELLPGWQSSFPLQSRGGWAGC